MMGDRQWPDPLGWEALTQDDATAAHRRRVLPLCTPGELAEELADIDRDLEQLAGARPVSADAAERAGERRATLGSWRDRVAEQLEVDGPPRCEACGAPYRNVQAHAEECTGR